MYFDNLSKIRLYNQLLPLQNDIFQLSDYSFDDGGSGPALELNAAAERFYLKPLDFACIKSLPAFADSAVPPQDLDPALKLAGLEILLAGPLQQLGALLDSNITVVNYQQYFQARPEQPYWCFKLKIGDFTVPLVLYANNDDAAQALQAKLQPLCARVAAATAENSLLPLLLSIIIGRMRLSAEEFSGLRVGDALVPDECALRQNTLLLLAGNLCARAVLQEGALQLGENFKTMAGSDMSDQKNTAGADLTALDNLQLEVVFELERQQISLKELKTLQAGSILPLQNRDLNQISLLINGQKAAEGRLIEVGDAFAVQLTRLPHD